MFCKYCFFFFSLIFRLCNSYFLLIVFHTHPQFVIFLSKYSPILHYIYGWPIMPHQILKVQIFTVVQIWLWISEMNIQNCLLIDRKCLSVSWCSFWVCQSMLTVTCWFLSGIVFKISEVPNRPIMLKSTLFCIVRLSYPVKLYSLCRWNRYIYDIKN